MVLNECMQTYSKIAILCVLKIFLPSELKLETFLIASITKRKHGTKTFIMAITVKRIANVRNVVCALGTNVYINVSFLSI